MASQQAYQAYAQQAAKGTLIPGQTIAVNKYTVQVERYLSQGLHREGVKRNSAHERLQVASPTYTLSGHQHQCTTRPIMS